VDRSSTGIAGWLRKGFVVLQVACATVLACGAFLLARTALHFARVDLGFEDQRLLSASPSYPHPWRVPESYLPLTDRIQCELAQIPGVASVAIRAAVPIPSREGTSSLIVEGSAEPLRRDQAPGSAQGISPGYFASLGVPIVTGRDFTEHDDSTSQRVAIVNRWAASRWWPGQSAIGRSIRYGGPGGKQVTVTVVGIIANNKAAQPNLLLAEEGPELYFPWAQTPSAFPQFLVRARSDPAPLERPVRLALTRLVPDRPLFTTPMHATVERQLGGVRSNAMQIGSFALIGLFLTVIGVYGVLAFETGRRHREIGIRSALGARRSRILRGVLFDAGRLAALGIIVGIPLAILTSRFIRGLLYSTDPADPVGYVVIAAAVTLVALLAALGPALRASRISPLIAIQAE
jgi:putative ABC transport system permease protein